MDTDQVSLLSSTLPPTTEHDEAVRLFKTICQWVVLVLNRSSFGNMKPYFELLPYACWLERCEQDVELSETSSKLLAMLSQAFTMSDCMATALNKIDEVSVMASWSARLSVIDVLQVLVFNNMTIVLSRDEWVQQVQTIVLRLLEDSVLEVREKTAEVRKLSRCFYVWVTHYLWHILSGVGRTVALFIFAGHR